MTIYSSVYKLSLYWSLLTTFFMNVSIQFLFSTFNSSLFAKLCSKWYAGCNRCVRLKLVSFLIEIPVLTCLFVFSGQRATLARYRHSARLARRAAPALGAAGCARTVPGAVGAVPGRQPRPVVQHTRVLTHRRRYAHCLRHRRCLWV